MTGLYVNTYTQSKMLFPMCVSTQAIIQKSSFLLILRRSMPCAAPLNSQFGPTVSAHVRGHMPACSSVEKAMARPA